MNRPIRFRYVWGRHKAWAGPYRPDDPKVIITFISLEDFENSKSAKPPIDVMKTPIPSTYSIIARNEFTGLLDTNGVEVFEGDIVKADGMFSCTIIFEDGGYNLDGGDSGLNLLYQLEKYGNWEVIGNIYSNPELLEVE